MEEDGREESDGGVGVDQFYVVDRVVADKPLNFIAFRQTMASVRGIMMKDLDENAFFNSTHA